MSGEDGVTRGKIWLVGTAHISPDSIEDVTQTITDVKPDVVAIELDDARYRQLSGEEPADIEPTDLLKGNTIFQFLAYWLLSYIQRRLGDRFNIEPGADMKAAIDTAETHEIEIALVDRDIQTTIQRFWAGLSFFEQLRLLYQLGLTMVGLGTSTTEIEIADLIDTDVVRAMIEELRRFSPGGAEALIDERDAYIAHNLLSITAKGHNVVAVVGAGHVDGIEHYLNQPRALPPLGSLRGTSRRRRFSVFKLTGYLVMLVFVSFFFLLGMAGVTNQFLLKLFAAWFVFNGVFAFSLAKLAGAHWSSATVGGLVAWLTSINPMLAPGWFAGYVELRHTQVSVGDISTLNDIMSDEESPIRNLLSRMIQVPLFKVIAIVAMTNIGSFIATILFPIVIIPWLAPEIGGVNAIGDLMVQGAQNSAHQLSTILGI